MLTKMTKIGTRFFGLLLACNLIWSCGHKEKFSVKDPSKREVFNIRSHVKKPSGVTVNIIGNIDGEAKVYVSPWNEIRISGSFEKTFYQDWFESNCEITYEPMNVRTGNVEIVCDLR